MSDEKDQHSEDPKSESNDCSNDDGKLAGELRNKKLEDLKRKAFYSVLLAFRAEPLTIGNWTHLVEKLMKELNIAEETRISFENNIQENLIAHQQRVISELKEAEAEAKSLTMSVSKPPLVPTYVATPSSSWGRVNPEALVGRRVSVRMFLEEEFEEFVIKKYNAKDETHHLESVDPDAMEIDELLSWIDFREVPTEDIIWRDGEAPNFETHTGLGAGQ